MRKAKGYFAVILACILVLAGFWGGKRIYQGAFTDDMQPRSNERTVISKQEGDASAEGWLNGLLMLQVTIPTCLTAGFLTAEEIREKGMEHQRSPH